jgi:cytochrome c oxidase subunit 2
MLLNLSNFKIVTDKTFLYLTGIAFLFLLGITIAMIAFTVLYNKKRHPNAVQIKDNITIEIIWIIFPIVLVVSMFYYGHKMFSQKKKDTKDIKPAKAIGMTLNSYFNYINDKKSIDFAFVKLNNPKIV